MLGYWLRDTPVHTNNPDILATSYVREDGRALIALASWSDRDEVVRLEVDWGSLGLGDGTAAGSRTPGVQGLQVEADVDLSELRVPAGMGLWVVVASGAEDIG